MRYLALACDYDGTIATHGRVDAETVRALERFVASGRRLILVTGRELPELLAAFPELPLFHAVVAENGALLYRPSDGQQQLLGLPPSEEFVQLLRERGVDRISVGKTIVATWEPHEVTVLQTIRDMGLELQVIFNKGAVMVLPAGVNKATGLRASLREFGLSPHEVVGVGDAENDHAFLSVCECSVAVANALPSVKERADVVTAADHGAGVTELIDRMLADDLASLDHQSTRHHLPIGVGHDGAELRIDPATTRLVLAQQTPRGLPDAAQRLLAGLTQANYQVVILAGVPHTMLTHQCVALGSPSNAPTVEELLNSLESPRNNLAVDLSALEPGARSEFVAAALAGLQALRQRTNRPHWIVLHEPSSLLAANGAVGTPSIDWPDNRLLVTSTTSSQCPTLTGGNGLALATNVDWLDPWLPQPAAIESPLASDETLVWRDGIVFRVRAADAS